jgi:hypothetical protein
MDSPPLKVRALERCLKRQDGKSYEGVVQETRAQVVPECGAPEHANSEAEERTTAFASGGFREGLGTHLQRRRDLRTLLDLVALVLEQRVAHALRGPTQTGLRRAPWHLKS